MKNVIIRITYKKERFEITPNKITVMSLKRFRRCSLYIRFNIHISW